MNSTARYTKTAILLHWLTFLLIAAALGLAWSLDDMPLSPAKLKLISWHKWAGITVLMLTALRLVWRFTHTPPALSNTLPKWQQLAAHGVHVLLYILLLAIPLSGWAMSCAKGYPVVYLGILPLPCLLAKNLELGEQLMTLHEFLNYALLALLGAHIAAAIKHHVIEKDDTLARMAPWIRSRSITEEK